MQSLTDLRTPKRRKGGSIKSGAEAREDGAHCVPARILAHPFSHQPEARLLRGVSYSKFATAQGLFLSSLRFERVNYKLSRGEGCRPNTIG